MSFFVTEPCFSLKKMEYSMVRLYQQEARVASFSQAGGRANRIDNETLDLIISLIEANTLIKLRK